MKEIPETFWLLLGIGIFMFLVLAGAALMIWAIQ